MEYLRQLLFQQISLSEEFQKERKDREERRKEVRKIFQNCTFDITEDGEEIVYFDDDAYIKVYEEEDEDD